MFDNLRTFSEMNIKNREANIINEKPTHLGSRLVYGGVIIDGVFVSSEQIRGLLNRDKISLFKGQCIACSGNHGGLQCPQMAITGKLEV